MVCIAAFIILSIIGIFVAFLSLFKREIGQKYWQVFKKAWGCVWRKARLQKCETGFKDDVKNTILSKVVIRHPKWVKPLGWLIEACSIFIVLITIWALATSVKSLLALWSLGTCNVTKPASCSLGAEVCSIDASEPQNPLEATGRWFTEWGEIFSAIPDKFKNYNPAEYDFAALSIKDSDQPLALDILDPGCLVCVKSLENQLLSDFTNTHNLKIIPFTIQNGDGSYKFKNSHLVVRYLLATEEFRPNYAIEILKKIFFTRDTKNVSYQTRFNNDYEESEVTNTIESWLLELNFSVSDIATIRELKDTAKITDQISKNRTLVENQIHVKGIPTTIYDGKKHTGLFTIK